MAGKDLILSLGPIDDMDCTWFNGQKVGAFDEPGFWQSDRIYTIPASLVKEGLNTIAIRVVDTQGGGGICGKESQLFVAEKDNKDIPAISISGEWKYMVAADFIDSKFYVFDITKNEFLTKKRPGAIMNQYSPSGLYNAMINPVVPYSIKGAIWYQGEANVGRAAQYEKIFPLMINNWRKAWNIGNFPFYYIQIAPYIYGDDVNAASSAELRDAQGNALNVPNTGMVVTLDIGNVYNIHPCDKQSVGNRLAFWALAKDYGKDIVFSGPLYKSSFIDGNSVKIQFNYTQGGLKAANGGLKEFEIAGSDGKFVPATAEIIDNTVVVSSKEVENPVAARYCWRNGAEATLFNGAGLPASVFKSK
jgi:sialate O-acetylesterase